MKSEETIKKVANIYEDLSKLFSNEYEDLFNLVSNEKVKEHYESMVILLKWVLEEEVVSER